MKLSASLSGPNPLSLLLATSKIPAFSSFLPTKLEVDDEEPPITGDWVQELNRARNDSCAYWENRKKQIELRPKSDLVTFAIPDGLSDLASALSVLEPLPFELAILGAPFSSEWIEADYERWGVGRSTVDHGWGCIFRGKGHDRLVSRRWLDFGPWRVLRRPNDTTVIQFHDLAITDPAEAYEQAKAGHERMGNSPIGGYIAWHLEGLLKGLGKALYLEDSRTRQIIVSPGESVSQGDMLCNAALRLHHRLHRPAFQPVERISYLFIDINDAIAHLHELWLRELECWSINPKGERVRLDLDYHPTPNPPDWVKRLDGR